MVGEVIQARPEVVDAVADYQPQVGIGRRQVVDVELVAERVRSRFECDPVGVLFAGSSDLRVERLEVLVGPLELSFYSSSDAFMTVLEAPSIGE